MVDPYRHLFESSFHVPLVAYLPRAEDPTVRDDTKSHFALRVAPEAHWERKDFGLEGWKR